MQRNGMKPAPPATEVKKCISYALRLMRDCPEQNDGSVKYKEVTFDSGYGSISIRIVAHSPFQKSHYQINHPAYGKWFGYLTSVSERNGEYGINVAAPRPM